MNKKIFSLILSLNSLLIIYAQNVNVTTFVGSGYQGGNDGNGNLASFRYPGGITTDVSGNMYLADQGNHKIRKITPAGDVSTFAGSNNAGSSDGTGSAAGFTYPYSIAVDLSGNVYVADTWNSKIRKITTSGEVSTLAGDGTLGSADGEGTKASFYNPAGIAVDANGNVFVADTFNNKIRKITPTGMVSTIAGNGTRGSNEGIGTNASFNGPYGLALDASGNIYVADTFNFKIRKISPTNIVSTYAGSGSLGSDDGEALNARFSTIYSLAFDGQGNMYLPEYGNHKIRKITYGGMVSTLAGSGMQGDMDGAANNASFYYPYGVTLDSSGNIYIVDSYNHKIRKITVTSLNSDEAAQNKTHKIYPNPSINEIFYEASEDGKVEIYSVDGLLLKTLQARKGINKIDISSLTVGNYILKSKDGTQKFLKK